MDKQLVAVGVLLVSGLVGSAQEKPPVHIVIQASSGQIKKAAMAMFARKGYTVDSDVALRVKISKPFRGDETVAYSTATVVNRIGSSPVRESPMVFTSAGAGGFDGSRAFEHVRHLVAIGPRPPGSDGIRQAQSYIGGQLKTFGCQVTEDDFHASTPIAGTELCSSCARPFEGKCINLRVRKAFRAAITEWPPRRLLGAGNSGPLESTHIVRPAGGSLNVAERAANLTLSHFHGWSRSFWTWMASSTQGTLPFLTEKV